MDPKQSAAPEDDYRITLTPDMRPLGSSPTTGTEPPGTQADAELGSTRPASRWPLALGVGGLVLGAAALALSVWTQIEGQREILRLSTELAQLKVSLDLYGRSAGSPPALGDLTERLSALEAAALGDTVPLPASASVVEPTAASGEDCLPVGMRLLVAAGDSYPICGQQAEVAVSFVDNGYITLSDGTSVASGGMTPLPGQPVCNLAVTSGGDEGLTGYAEIRVTC